MHTRKNHTHTHTHTHTCRHSFVCGGSLVRSNTKTSNLRVRSLRVWSSDFNGKMMVRFVRKSETILADFQSKRTPVAVAFSCRKLCLGLHSHGSLRICCAYRLSLSLSLAIRLQRRMDRFCLCCHDQLSSHQIQPLLPLSPSFTLRLFAKK